MTAKSYSFGKEKLTIMLFISMIAVSLMLVSGCAFLQPAKNETQHYLLTARHAATEPSKNLKTEPGCVVRIRPVDLSNYLSTRDIVVRTGTNEVRFEEYQRWAEPLDAGIRRVLAEDLETAPQISSVLTDQPAPANKPVYSIFIHVLACGGKQTGQQGSMEFKAVWQISRLNGHQTVVAHGRFQAQPTHWHPGDFGQLAAQLSDALGNFNHVLVQAIRENSAD